MRLSAPKQISFLIAVILAILADVANLIAIPTISGFAFWVLVIAFIVLAIANIMDGFSPVQAEHIIDQRPPGWLGRPFDCNQFMLGRSA